MKKTRLNQKIRLSKATVSNLDFLELSLLRGGEYCPPPVRPDTLNFLECAKYIQMTPKVSRTCGVNL